MANSRGMDVQRGSTKIAGSPCSQREQIFHHCRLDVLTATIIILIPSMTSIFSMPVSGRAASRYRVP